MKYKHEENEICYTRELVHIDAFSKKGIEINRRFTRAAFERFDFMKRPKTDAKIIPVEELEMHKIALFQNNHPLELNEYSLSDILNNFEVNRETGKVTAEKIWYRLSNFEIEKRTYYIENYNKTWRAWTALPEDDQAKWE